ncbi:MAG: hypothetical protein IJ932_04385, partial [Ruminococcus sp.]|nr:hypothetical protein [Ruminococcus sp.]
MKFIRKSVSVILSLILIISLFTILPPEAFAAAEVQYIERSWDSANQKVVDTVKTCTDYTTITSQSSLTIGSGKWYVVNGDATIDKRVTVSGTAHIILLSGTLKCMYGIRLSKGNSLFVYPGKNSEGKLNPRTGDDEQANLGGNKGEDCGEFVFYGGTLDVFNYDWCSGATAIGGGGYGGNCGKLSFYGGTVDASNNGAAPTRKSYGAVIGDGSDAYSKDSDCYINIYGGTIKADNHAYSNGSGIGGGEDSTGCPINILGGKITARAYNGAGIGSGQDGGSSTVTIKNATVEAESDYGGGIGSGEDSNSKSIIIENSYVKAESKTDSGAVGAEGAGIGGGNCGKSESIKISKSIIIASSGRYGAGIGGGDESDGGNIEITDSNVFAHSAQGGAGIGGGDEKGCNSIVLKNSFVTAITDSDINSAGEKFLKDYGDYYNTIMLSISSPAISEQAGFYAGGALTAMAIAYLIQGTQTGAGIGSGDSGTVNSIQIDNCVVLATGGRCGAGIGGGDEGNFGTININNSNVYAEGGDYGAGIGTGDEANDGGTINIKKSTVTAKAGTDAAGIGGGNECKVNSINIEDSTITAHGGSYAAGIGGGDTEDGGNITIDFSDVKAYAGKDGAGIGGGEDGDGGTIEIYSSTVYSEGKGDGAGIGNGEDGNESDITIWGEDTSVKAWGGSGGGKAIGFSDNGWFHNQTSYTTFGKNIRAKAGSNENSTNYYTGSSIHKAVRSNRFAYIYSCPHDNIGWHYYDEYYHNKYCIDCGKEFTTYKDKELHTYNSDHKCTVCGSADLETEITVVEKNKNGSQVTRTINSPMHDSYVLPECENVPDGYEFVCWCIRTGGSFEVPGNSISLYPYEKMKITAIYLPVVETQYLDADGEIKTVKARVIDSWENISKAHSVIGNYLLLTEGWYVVNKDIITKYNFRYFHNVNVIIADGKTLSFTEPRWNARIEEISAFYPDRLLGQDENYISIYGQSEQSGVLDIRGRGMIIHNLRINSCEVLFDGEDDWIDFTKPGKENCVINGGRINGGEVAAGILEIYGGNVNLKTANYSEIHLGWKELSDRIKIDDLSCTVSPFANIITIKDGQALVDESGNIYEGTLTETQKTAMQGRTLTPYLKHNYSEPQWEWLDDSKSANAVFTCQDSGCGDEQVIPAEVTYEDKDNLRNSTAVCEFNGKTYTATHTTKLLWDVKIQNNAHGAITADKGKAKARDEISLDFTPNNGYLLKSWSVTPDDGEQSVKTKSTQFVMPECDVTVSAEFVPITPKTEPYIDQNGEYHLGIAEHVEIDGEPYSVNEDGTIGEYLDSIELSYFDFALINNDSEYQIKYYTGPTDISELVIPKTFNGKPVTVLGVDNNDTFINYGENSKTQFDLVLNENIREIKNRSFYTMWVKKVTGDTSGLKIIGAYAFSWANSPDGYKLDIKLDYEGEIDVDTKIFNNMNVTMRLKHATTFDSNSFGQQSISYIFADAHSYGEPVWKWSSDNSSATATFTCTNSRCKHTETVDATVTVDNQRDKKIYTATAQLDGETCSDTKTVNKTLSSINVAATEHGTVTADKAEAYEGEEVKLTITPDTGYKLSTLTVIDENNQELNITDGSFTMPDCAVNVSATFEQKSCSITYAETDCGWIHGAYSANYDDEIELNITPASGYEIDTLTVTDDNENVIPVTDNKFSMPDSDVTVSATFKKSDLNITYGPFEHGTITGAATAQFNDHVPLTIIPDEGYAAMNVYAEDDGWGELAYIIDNELYMLDGDVTVYAEFVPVTPAQEPYIDENGEYHLGNIEHCEIDGYYFAVENGIVGSSLDSVEVSYFDFTDNGDSYQINYYTGPTENLTELVIPKTYKNKPITILGTDNQSAFIANANPKTQFTLTLNENIQEIKGYSFYTMWVKKVQGDTSNLKRIGDYAFSWANSPDGYKLDIKLDYEGTIMVGRGIFNNMTVTARVHHATGFSYGSFMQKSLTYVITDDAHSYGNPTWDWDDDYSTATAKFTCADSRCKHEETVDAAITSEYENGAPKYTATALFENKTYTDVNALSNLLDASYYPSITAAGARDSDGNQFNLPNDLIYKKATLLGVQKKEAIKTDTAGTG